MKRLLRALHLLALVAAIFLAVVFMFLLGWPIRLPHPATYYVIFYWLIATVFIGSRWTHRNAPAATVAIAHRAFIGSAIGLVLLGLTFLTPQVAVECRSVYYHYPVPGIDALVEKIAQRLDNGGC